MCSFISPILLSLLYRSKEASSEGDDFDQNAAFFTKVVSKKKKAGNVPETTTGGKTKSNKESKKEEEVSLRINVLFTDRSNFNGNSVI